MPHIIPLAARIALALAFMVAATLKLRAFVSVGSVRTAGNQQQDARPILFGGLAVIELGIAAALLVPQAATIAAATALMLLCVFSGYIWWLVRRTGQARCGCFGNSGWSEIAVFAFPRNALLAALAAVSLTESLGVPSDLSIEALARASVLWVAPLSILVLFSLSRSSREQTLDLTVRSKKSDVIQKRLIDVTLPSENGSIVRLSEVRAESTLVLCVHRGCEDCDRLVNLTSMWSSGPERYAIIVTPRGAGVVEKSENVAFAIDQTFEVGRLCGAQEPPVACVIRWDGHQGTEIVHGHQEVGALLLGVANFGAVTPLPV